MRIGVCYYPEQWDAKLWGEDIRLMAETGVKVVRLAEFAWCRLEPSDGNFDFSWLDEVIALFDEYKIDVVIGTPTNCPPRWLCEAHPEILLVGDDGRTNPIGIRGHRCVNSPVFRKYAERMIRGLCGHYKDNPRIIAWQIDNELEPNICYCGNCNQRHREWLKNKYGTLSALNKAYGNVVWSGEYSSWEQIDPPYGKDNPAWLNPSYMLDIYRRTNEDMAEFAKFQAEMIRSVIPNAVITTNTWFCGNTPDFYKLFQQLDFAAFDNYPTTNLPNDYEDIFSHAPHLDLMRGIKRKNFWVMEQLSGGMGCWMPMQKTTRPGMIKGYALQAFAHGADTVVHFRWRTANIGAEMHWHGLIDHSNVPGRRFHEFQDLCKTAKELESLENTEIRSEIAVLYSIDSDYALRLQPQTDGYHYFEQIKLFHQGFARFGVNVDIIDEHNDFSKYRIVCVPSLYVTDKNVVKRVYDFVRAGGTILISARSGAKDGNNNCIMEQLPTVYRELTGCHVEEYDPIGYSNSGIVFEDGECFGCKQWCDIVEADNAEVIARYDRGFYQGKPAITRNRYDKGLAYYIGTVGERTLYERLSKNILDESHIEYFGELPQNVEVTMRTGDGMKALFVFNNSDMEKAFVMNGKELELAPFEMKVMKEE